MFLINIFLVKNVYMLAQIWEFKTFDCLKHEEKAVIYRKAISDTMNKYVCSIAATLQREIENSPNPLLSV